MISVADSITIKTGDASITMKKNGDIQIKGNNLKLEGSGKIQVKAASDVNIKGSKVTNN
jgi:type VI secretion system secreted protein VgrG